MIWRAVRRVNFGALSKTALIASAIVASAATQAEETYVLPAAPIFESGTYPACQFDYRARNLAVTRAEEATRCIEELDTYYASTLAPFWTRMIQHRDAIDVLLQRGNGVVIDGERADLRAFLLAATAERESSEPEGALFTAYREYEQRFRDDRSFLEERFCRYAGCEGFEQGAETTERDAADGMHQCGDEPGNSMFVEGMLGNLIRRVQDLRTGTNFTGAMLDIACRLRPEERQRAAEASEQVVSEERVGATAEWTSPTREEVSGSSTITAMRSEPSGSSCLEIVDVVIIDGEEARMTKTMCRAPGEARYVLQA